MTILRVKVALLTLSIIIGTGRTPGPECEQVTTMVLFHTILHLTSGKECALAKKRQMNVWDYCFTWKLTDWIVEVQWPRWGLWPTVVAVGRDPHWTDSECNQQLEREWQRMKRRQTGGNSAPGYAVVDPEFYERYPRLFEHLAALQYEGEEGGSRQTSTLLLFAQDGVWKCFLRDRDAGEFLPLSFPSFEGLLDALEAALGEEVSVWRKDRASGAPEANRIPRKKT